MHFMQVSSGRALRADEFITFIGWRFVGIGLTACGQRDPVVEQMPRRICLTAFIQPIQERTTSECCNVPAYGENERSRWLRLLYSTRMIPEKCS